jgi:serine/threonine protein kinase
MDIFRKSMERVWGYVQNELCRTALSALIDIDAQCGVFQQSFFKTLDEIILLHEQSINHPSDELSKIARSMTKPFNELVIVDCARLASTTVPLLKDASAVVQTRISVGILQPLQYFTYRNLEFAAALRDSYRDASEMSSSKYLAGFQDWLAVQQKTMRVIDCAKRWAHCALYLGEYCDISSLIDGNLPFDFLERNVAEIESIVNHIRQYAEKKDFQYAVQLLAKSLCRNEDRERILKTIAKNDSAGRCDTLDEFAEVATIAIPGYSIVRRIGRGWYKKTYLAENVNRPEIKRAVKLFDLREWVVDDLATAKDCALDAIIEGEIGKMWRAQNIYDGAGCASISRLVDVHLTADGRVAIVEELYDCTLKAFISERESELCLRFTAGAYAPGNTPERYLREERFKTAIGLTRKIAAALAPLHAAGMYHGDITEKNIGVKGNTLKIADFGMSSLLKHMQGPRVGITHAAPEVIQGGMPDQAADVWSLGIIAYRAYFGNYPYEIVLPSPSEERKKAVAEFMNDFDNIYDQCIAQPLKQRHWMQSVGREECGFIRVLGNLLHKDPHKRPALPQILDDLKDENLTFWSAE